MLRSVNFEFDHDQLTAPATSTLDEVATALKANPGIAIEIVGHTDAIGSEPYNMALSQRRANAVLRYLAANGVDTSRFEVRGVGESDPVADNSTPEGRAENRRADFSVSAAAGDAAISAPSTPESKAAAMGESKRSRGDVSGAAGNATPP
jgi:OOP family OmpA-OmpF porin